MHINEKLNLVGCELVNTVELLQEILSKNESDESIKEILLVALHYCSTIMTMKELSQRISLSLYKDDIKKQLALIDEFIYLTSDLKIKP